jgi:probable F420-dependent oxidoreductase
MKVGVNLLNFGPTAGPDSFLRWARLAEALGYHFLMISDHIALTPDVRGPYPAPFYDPFATLCWLAGLTERVELGTTVIILPYRHPLQVARLAANLDQLSHGRFILGVGAGWARQEFEALGLPFERRGAMTDDYLAAIIATWTADVATHHGPFVTFDDVATGPRPVQVPHPPIWVGGNGAAARRRAVRFGDAWHPISFRMRWLTETALPHLRATAEELDRPIPALCPRIRLRLTGTPLDDEQRLAGEGTLDQVRADLAALDDLGATYVLLDSYTGDPEATRQHEPAWAMLATLAEQVLDLARERLR